MGAESTILFFQMETCFGGGSLAQLLY